MTYRDFFTLSISFIITRICIVLIGVIALTYLPSTEGEEYTHLIDAPPALDMWYRWDAGFYTTIATYGYDWVNEQRPTSDMAFFPLYPSLVHVASGLTAEGCLLADYWSTCATIGGVIVSNLALFGALVVMFYLVKHHHDKRTAWQAVALLLVSPISIYLSGVYTEALFLFLTLAVFLLLAKDRFLFAVAVGVLACLTRPVGIALYPALLWMAWHSAPEKRNLRLISAQVLPIVFVGYILGMGLSVGEPLAYFQANASIWERTAGSFLDGFTVYLTSDSIALWGWHPSWLDLGMTFLFLALAVVIIRRNVAWGLFTAVALIIPISSGTLSAMPRYGLVIFSFYIVLATLSQKLWQKVILYSVSIGLAVLMIVQFVRWKWIA
jgi:hypothetical protein